MVFGSESHCHRCILVCIIGNVKNEKNGVSPNMEMLLLVSTTGICQKNTPEQLLAGWGGAECVYRTTKGSLLVWMCSASRVHRKRRLVSVAGACAEAHVHAILEEYNSEQVEIVHYIRQVPESKTK